MSCKGRTIDAAFVQVPASRDREFCPVESGPCGHKEAKLIRGPPNGLEATEGKCDESE